MLIKLFKIKFIGIFSPGASSSINYTNKVLKNAFIKNSPTLSRGTTLSLLLISTVSTLSPQAPEDTYRIYHFLEHRADNCWDPAG